MRILNTVIAMKGLLKLEGMQFNCCHGCFPSERVLKNLYIVDFEAITNIDKAGASDALEDTIDYGEIYEMIGAIMNEPSNLIEHIAYRIVKEAEERFPELPNIKATVSKNRPCVDGVMEWSRITATGDRK